MPGAMKKPNGEPTRKKLALDKWNCYVYISWEFDTRRQTQIMNKKLKHKMITAMVFLAEDTNGMVIHLNGFDEQKTRRQFCKKVNEKKWD